jgi:hypothetical protein
MRMFGSLKNVARRLLESVRFLFWEEGWQTRIGLDSS